MSDDVNVMSCSILSMAEVWTYLSMLLTFLVDKKQNKQMICIRQLWQAMCQNYIANPEVHGANSTQGKALPRPKSRSVLV